MGDEAGRMTAEPCAGCGCKWKRCKPDTPGSDTGDVVCAYCGTFQSRYEFTDLPAAPVGSDEGQADLPDAETAWREWFPVDEKSPRPGEREAFLAGLDAANAEREALKQEVADRVGDLVTLQRQLDAALARNAELERDIELLSQGAGSPGVVTYIAEKQRSEKEATTYIHELQAKNTTLRAELDNLRSRLNALGTKWEDLALAPIDKGPGFSVRPHYAYFADELHAAIVRGSDDEAGEDA